MALKQITILSCFLHCVVSKDFIGTGTQSPYEVCTSLCIPPGGFDLMCINMNLEYVPQDTACYSARILQLGYNRIRQLTSGAFMNFETLEILALTGNEIVDISVGAFIGLTKLQALHISKNKLEKLRPGVFNGLEVLNDRITVADNYLNVIRKDVFTVLHSVKLLYLHSNQISVIEAHSFEGMEELTHLFLQRNSIQRIENATFNGLRKLKSLDLSENNISVVTTNAFIGMTSLDHLNLSSNYIISIGAITQLPGLRSLYIKNNSISRLGDHLSYRLKKQDLKISIAGNPLYCDCSMNVLRQWYENEQSSHIEDASCALPEEYAGWFMRTSPTPFNCSHAGAISTTVISHPLLESMPVSGSPYSSAKYAPIGICLLLIVICASCGIILTHKNQCRGCNHNLPTNEKSPKENDPRWKPPNSPPPPLPPPPPPLSNLHILDRGESLKQHVDVNQTRRPIVKPTPQPVRPLEHVLIDGQRVSNQPALQDLSPKEEFTFWQAEDKTITITHPHTSDNEFDDEALHEKNPTEQERHHFNASANQVKLPIRSRKEHSKLDIEKTTCPYTTIEACMNNSLKCNKDKGLSRNINPGRIVKPTKTTGYVTLPLIK